MRTNITIKELQEKVKNGTLVSFVVKNEKKIELKEPNGRIVSKVFKKTSKGKSYVEAVLFDWSQKQGLVLVQEFRFHPTRKWKFDFVIQEMMLAVEFEGGIFDRNGSHSSFRDMSDDIEKYNEAQQLGWTVLRFTAVNYLTIEQALKKYEK